MKLTHFMGGGCWGWGGGARGGGGNVNAGNWNCERRKLELSKWRAPVSGRLFETVWKMFISPIVSTQRALLESD